MYMVGQAQTFAGHENTCNKVGRTRCEESRTIYFTLAPCERISPWPTALTNGR